MPGAPLDAVVEEPELDDDAFERLAQHIGVHPVVVEAVWRLVAFVIAAIVTVGVVGCCRC